MLIWRFCGHIGFLTIFCLMLGGCTTKIKDGTRPTQDGHPPPHMIPKHLDRIPDAEPKVEPLSRYGNRFKKNTTNVYVALKKPYAVLASSRGYKARGQASWYGTKFQGRKTSSGEPYDMFAMTAAHRTLPLPTYARVTNIDNGKSIIVKVNDRGPFHNNRLIDLSYVAAHKLGIIGRGTGRVEIESVDPRDHPGIRKHHKTKFGKTAVASNIVAKANTTAQMPAATQASNKNQMKAINPPQIAATSLPIAQQKNGAIKSKPPTATDESKTPTTLAMPVVVLSSKPVISKNISDKGKIFLQLGAFNQKGNAEELAKKLGKFSKQATQISENTSQKGARYRVRIGPFNSREEAQLLSQTLNKQEFPKSVVLAD